MRIFSYFLFLLFCISTGVLAEVDQRLIDNVYAMTSPKYKKGENPISRPVQTINMLAHELSLYADEKVATAAAKSIVSMVTKGDGVKGLREATHRSRRRFLNEVEKELVIHAVTKAADYLQHQGLLDPFLESSMGSMAVTWDTDDATRKHGSVVLSLLMAARERAEAARTATAADIDNARARAFGLIPNHHADIALTISEDGAWHYAEAYMAGPAPTHRYNAITWKLIERDRDAELAGDRDFATRIPAAFPVRALMLAPDNVAFINALAEELERTFIPEKAAILSKQIMDSLKHTDTDLRSLATPGGNSFRTAVIRALAAVEKFRMLVIGRDNIRPTVFDYENEEQNPDSQAVLVALVNAIQNYLYNPSSTVPSLKKLFSYQSNDRRLAPLKGALSAVNLDIFINEDLIEALYRPIHVNYFQGILIDQENLKQKLKFFWMPTFNKQTGEITHNPTFVRYYGSSTLSNQCGFFSLGYKSREEAKRQIVDNLQDKDIFVLADKVSAASSRIVQLMNRLSQRSVMTEAEIAAEIAAKVEAKRQALTQKFLEEQEKKKKKEIRKQLSSIESLKRKALKEELEELKRDLTSHSLDSAGEERAFQLFTETEQQKIEQMKDELTRLNLEITASIEREIDEKTALALAEEIPHKATDLVLTAEQKEDAATVEFLNKVKAKHGLPQEGPALMAQVVELYRAKAAKIEEDRNAVQSRIDKKKETEGFPSKVPHPREIALWMHLKQAEVDFRVLSAKEISRRTVNEIDGLRALNADLVIPEKDTEFETFVSKPIMDTAEKVWDQIAAQISAFNTEERELETWRLDAKLTKFFYSLEDFQSIVWQNIHDVFAQNDSGKIDEVDEGEGRELLEFPPHPEWRENPPTYPLLLAKLNNYNIGGWTSKSYLASLQTDRVARDVIVPIYKTENDKEYALVSYIPINEDAKRVDTANLGGGHFEKLIRADDRPQTVRALCHALTYNITATRPIALF